MCTWARQTNSWYVKVVHALLYLLKAQNGLSSTVLKLRKDERDSDIDQSARHVPVAVRLHDADGIVRLPSPGPGRSARVREVAPATAAKKAEKARVVLEGVC